MYKILWFHGTGFQEEKIPKIKEFIHIFGGPPKKCLKKWKLILNFSSLDGWNAAGRLAEKFW